MRLLILKSGSSGSFLGIISLICGVYVISHKTIIHSLYSLYLYKENDPLNPLIDIFRYQ